MRILIVADGRSPTTRSWLRALTRLGIQVDLLSSYPCERPDHVSQFQVLPLAFGSLGGAIPQSSPGQPSGAGKKSVRQNIGRFRSFFLALRSWIGPLTLLSTARRFRRICADWHPDLVHALRIPFEGMLASFTPGGTPYVVSIWGNDLTLHARSSPLMAALTRRTLQGASGLLADTQRDLRLARQLGLSTGSPTLEVSGSGGVDVDHLRAHGAPLGEWAGGPYPDGTLLVVNPRGIRPGSLRTDTFFQAIPKVLEQFPNTYFVCAAMVGQPEAEGWVKRLVDQYPSANIAHQVRLLPYLPQESLWNIFHQSQVMVSPGLHDGTPNSLLEAMACGCFPVAGDIESLREWISPGENGLLFPPDKPDALSEALCQALGDCSMRKQAAQINLHLVQERASTTRVGEQVKSFYQEVIGRNGNA